MKTTRLAIVLAALTTGASLAVAQNEDLIQKRLPAPPAPSAEQADILAQHELQLAASKDQLEQAERAIAASQRAMQVAQAKAVEPARAYARTISGGAWRSGSGGRALVIPKEATDAKSLAEVEEDMNVMAHILEKAASGDRKSGRAMGIPVFGKFSWGGSSPQNLFIEGSGALFFLSVNYPLQPAPDKEAVTETKEKPTSEWDEAKKEMAGPRGGGGADAFAVLGELERNFMWDNGSSSPYDAGKVEDLKTDLIAVLKNAANIRKLKGDETVTVVVNGPGALGSGGKTIKTAGAKPAPSREDEMRMAELAELKGGDRASAVAPAKLVLRARKSDAEALQNGKQSLDEFKKNVTVMIY